MSIVSWVLLGYFMGYISTFLNNESYRHLVDNIKLTMGGSVVGGIFANLIFGFKLWGFDIPAFGLAFLFVLLILILNKLFNLYRLNFKRIINLRLSI